MRLVPSLLIGSLLVVVACSDSSSSSSSSSSSGGSSSGGSSSGGSSSGGSSGGATDSGAAISGCTTFVDRSADGDTRTLQWDFGVVSRPERCMKIKVGQKVKFVNETGGVADFAQHPVAANGGTQPNTVTNLDTDTGEVSFAAKGTYGFTCNVHPAMVGAFEVVE